MNDPTTTSVAARREGSREGNGASQEALAAALERIELRLARLEAAVARVEDGAAGAPAAIASVVDTMDDVADGLRSRGIDIDDRLTTLLAVMDRLTQPAALSAVSSMLDKVDEVRYLLESGVFEPHAVHVVAELGRSLATSGERTPPRVGGFGALRAMSDPDVQRAVGFTLTLARSFGASLRDLERVAEERKALTQGSTP